MKRVLLALSGGVDSSVAALLTQQAGYEVTGVTMLLWGGKRQGSSCSTADASAAQAAADHLGIELKTVDWTEAFRAQVSAKYREEHLSGLTGNPCIDCNRAFKLEGLARLGREWGYDHVATGHYARVSKAGLLQRAADPAKDQSYVLAPATREILGGMLFPLGDLHKSEVRQIADDYSVPAAQTKDSMGLCLDRADLLGPVSLTLKRADGTVVGQTPSGGLVTVGQRKGLGLGGGAKSYVVDLDLARKEATVGSFDDLIVREQKLNNWMALDTRTPETFQVSAHGRPTTGKLQRSSEGEVIVVWAAAERRVSPGQTVVGYYGDEVVGYGTAGRVEATQSVPALSH